MKELNKQRVRWSHNTFGPPNIRGPQGSLLHLAKEVAEAQAQYENDGASPAFLEEMVDVIWLALDVVDRAGFTWADLMRVMYYKLEVNMRRAWPDWQNIDPNEPIHHIK